MDDGVRWAFERTTSAGDVFLSSVLQEAAGNRAIGRIDRERGTGNRPAGARTKTTMHGRVRNERARPDAGLTPADKAVTDQLGARKSRDHDGDRR